MSKIRNAILNAIGYLNANIDDEGCPVENSQIALDFLAPFIDEPEKYRVRCECICGNYEHNEDFVVLANNAEEATELVVKHLNENYKKVDEQYWEYPDDGIVICIDGTQPLADVSCDYL